MSEARLKLRRAFLWQGAVILLPIIVLVAIGFYVLKQDRAAVTEEARQRANEIALDLSDRLSHRLASELSGFDLLGNLWAGDGIIGGWVHWPGRSPLTAENLAIYHKLRAEWQTNYSGLRPADVFPIQASLTEAGELEFPKDYAIPPTPARWIEDLSSEQQSLWREATTHHLNPSDTNAVRAAFQEFLSSNPPASAKANAEFALLLLDLNDIPPAERVEKLISFAAGHGSELSESGLPVTALALARAVQAAESVGLTEELFNALNDETTRNNPSFLSPRLLAEEQRLAARESPAVRQAVGEVRLRWESQERLRALAQQIRRMLAPRNALTTNLWFDFIGQRWLAILDSGEVSLMTHTKGQPVTFTNRITNVRFFPGLAVRQAADLALSRTVQKLPEYFRTELSVEGERIGPALDGNPRPALLAYSESRLPFFSVPPLSKNPSEEFRSQNGFATSSGQPRFAVAIYLVDPARLYVQARRRARVFGGLILAAATVAVLGVARIFQALVRQQRLNEMKSNFVSSVSHELRAPIASVQLLAEGLESGRVKDDQKRHEYFKFIVQECRRLTSLIENVLDFSRIEQGRKEFAFEPVDIAALVEQTVKLMQTYADDKNVCLVTAANNVPRLTCDLQLIADGRALQQALVNLIDNAIKHSPSAATVTIGLDPGASVEDPSRITHHASRLAASRLHLWVEDHGEGIPPHEHDRIFERFYRRGSELRRETQGVGIGLSIVKHVVEAHGGRVLVRSAVGEGSRFTIELPLISNSAVEPQRPPDTKAEK